MPLFLVILGLAIGAYALGRRAARRTAQVGAGPQRPPLAYAGDWVFSLPQRRWGRVECVACAPGACRYGVRFPGGNAVVLAAHEIVR